MTIRPPHDDLHDVMQRFSRMFPGTQNPRQIRGLICRNEISSSTSVWASPAGLGFVPATLAPRAENLRLSITMRSLLSERDELAPVNLPADTIGNVEALLARYHTRGKLYHAKK